MGKCSFSYCKARTNSQPTVSIKDQNYVKLPDGVVYHNKDRRLYFTNMGIPHLNDGSVSSVSVDGSDPCTVLSLGQIHTPKQLAFDEVSDKLYICDREGLRVMRCNLDGSDLETLIKTGDSNDTTHARDQTRWCVGITICHRSGLFYWTQKGYSKSGTGRIFCAPIEGDNKELTLLLDHLPEPIDLHFNDSMNTLYWTDRGEVPYGNTFNRIVLDNTGTCSNLNKFTLTIGLNHEVLIEHFNEAIGLCFDTNSRTWYVADIEGTI